MYLLLINRISLSTWGMSDALLWAASEALLAYQRTVAEGGLGEYLRRRAMENMPIDLRNNVRDDTGVEEVPHEDEGYVVI